MLKLSKYPSRGFTLIELLVVVLIVGILAAIAIPQYQLAVDKAKFAGYQTIAKNLADAYRRYLLVHDAAPDDIEKLDVELPEGYTKKTPSASSCTVFEDFYCCLGQFVNNFQSGHINCGKRDYTNAVYLNVYVNNKDRTNILCYAKKDNARAMRLCENFPHTNKINNNLPTPTGHKTGYFSYQLN